MAGASAKRFRALLEPLPGGLGWVVARVPFDAAKTWKKLVRLRILVVTGGETFRTSLFADANRGGHFILVNKKMQKAAGVKAGGMIELTVSPDFEAREAEAPPELAKILTQEKALAKWYATLSESIRREIVKWVHGVESREARQRRAEQMAERLMLAMEGEGTLPPILDVAFRAKPEARKGWAKMTPVQRRGNLLAIFYYQSPEARQKRTDKVVEDCLRAAKR